MSQESEHGKWTVSSSDESGDEQAEPEKNSTSLLQEASRENASGPQYPCSEARKAALKRKSSPLKLDNGDFPEDNSPAKTQKPSPQGLGWCLSSSDEEDVPQNQTKEGDRAASVRREEYCAPKEVAHSELALSHKSADPPDTLPDAWDLLNRGNPFRFFLTKVKGIKTKYNSGALHIKGKYRYQERNVFRNKEVCVLGDPFLVRAGVDVPRTYYEVQHVRCADSENGSG